MGLSPNLLSGLLWIGFILYWSAAAAGAAPSKSSESPGSRQVHVLLMYASLALAFYGFAPLDRRWLPRTAWLIAAGFVVQLGAMALAIWARRHLGRNWSGAITAKVDHQLVRTGPYRRIRHPIYTGMLGMFLGTALISGEWHALLGLAVISVAYGRKIRLEEQHLQSLFGADYSAYVSSSAALVPWLF